tara:strand:+ start:5414 stop:5626 length:213 start_codon:yes stop_codon:yes gene_type:complete
MNILETRAERENLNMDKVRYWIKKDAYSLRRVLRYLSSGCVLRWDMASKLRSERFSMCRLEKRILKECKK